MAAAKTRTPDTAQDPSSTYKLLSAPFEHTFTDVRGGVELTYVSGEQVTTRLNQVLGAGGWSFRILRHDVNVEADEAWALGEIVAEIEGKSVTRQQFGSQKVKRSRSSGVPLDIGFDLKGAATDAMKKCASLLGVGLYLSRKEAAPNPLTLSRHRGSSAPAGEGLACENCGVGLRETRFKDGTVWDAAQLAGFGRRKHGRVLCFTHYRIANEQRKATRLDQVTA